MAAKDFWKVHINGDMFEGEISVLRNSNKHGQDSWGWDDRDDKIVVHTTSIDNFKLINKRIEKVYDGEEHPKVKSNDPAVYLWDRQVKLAGAMAKWLNKNKA